MKSTRAKCDVIFWSPRNDKRGLDCKNIANWYTSGPYGPTALCDTHHKARLHLLLTPDTRKATARRKKR